MWSKYGKAWTAVAALVLAVIASAVSGDGRISGEEWFQIAVAFGNAILVYLVPAVPEWPWMKTAVSAILVGVTAAASFALDGWSTQDTVNVVIAVLGAAFVSVAPSVTKTWSTRLSQGSNR